MRLVPKGWEKFQHYKNRNPPWIKLHKQLLDDWTFHSLPDASKALAPLLWLLASEHQEGVIEGTEAQLAFRLRCSEKKLVEAVKPLVSAGLFWTDSALLAGCERVARLETETETETETEGETESCTEPPAASVQAPEDEVLYRVPCKGTGPSSWPITRKKLDEWAQAFPGIDVKAELRKAIQWLKDNPTKAKTHAGMARYFGSWLGKAQDSPRRTTPLVPNREPGRKVRDEHMAQMLEAYGG